MLGWVAFTSVSSLAVGFWLGAKFTGLGMVDLIRDGALIPRAHTTVTDHHITVVPGSSFSHFGINAPMPRGTRPPADYGRT